VKWQFYGMIATSKYYPYPRVSRRLKSIQMLQGNNMTTYMRPPRPHMRPQFVTTIKESGRVPPFPSACLPRDTTCWAIRGWFIHYFGIHFCRRGEGSSNSATAEASKIVGTHKSCMRQYIIKLAHRGQTIDP
jgi:hypothetical protein